MLDRCSILIHIHAHTYICIHVYIHTHTHTAPSHFFNPSKFSLHYSIGADHYFPVSSQTIVQCLPELSSFPGDCVQLWVNGYEIVREDVLLS